jgi:isoquinoline 1-oxidoreductase beta subunit
MNDMPKFDRRTFLVGAAAAGGGFSLGFNINGALADTTVGSPEVNAWVVVKPDDSVVIRVVRPDMGQGSRTGLAQMVVEELECDWNKVTTEYPTPGQNLARKRVWGAMNSTGSQAIRTSNEYVRKGGAAARMMLMQAAAEEWKVPVEELSVSKGIIKHQKSRKTTTYGKVAAAAAKLDPPKDIKLKDPKDWKVIGTSPKRFDTINKVNGTHTFGMDVKVPGMVLASIRQCPVNGGKVKSFDAKKVEGMRGVKKVVQVGDAAVAVVADNFWNAKQACYALPIEWDVGDSGNVSSASIADFLKEGLTAEKAFIGNKKGDVDGAISGATRKVEATYSYPFLNHACMEPMNATALYTPDKCEVWCGTQNAEAALATVIEASGLPAPKCEVYKMELGGGFGRRGRTDFVQQAVLIAKEMPGTPVKLIWTREEDMTHCSYHPITQCQMSAGLDDKGNVTGLHMRISGQSILASLAPERLDNGMDAAVFQGLTPSSPEGAFGYEIPNVLIDHAMRNTHLTAGFWRGVNANHNAIYVESFIDELAHETKTDPLEFRKKLLKPKQFAVLNAAAQKAGYGKPLPKGHFHGLSSMNTFGSYVAACAEVSVDDGRLIIHRIVGATDPGHAVHPALIERQVAGSFVFGLSALLYGECTVKNGAVEQTNFDTYNVMRMDEMPKIDVIVMPSGGFWGGVGEPTIAAAAPAVLNAIFAATGKRIRNFPLMNQSLTTA